MVHQQASHASFAELPADNNGTVAALQEDLDLRVRLQRHAVVAPEGGFGGKIGRHAQLGEILARRKHEGFLLRIVHIPRFRYPHRQQFALQYRKVVTAFAEGIFTAGEEHAAARLHVFNQCVAVFSADGGVRNAGVDEKIECREVKPALAALQIHSRAAAHRAAQGGIMNLGAWQAGERLPQAQAVIQRAATIMDIQATISPGSEIGEYRRVFFQLQVVGKAAAFPPGIQQFRGFSLVSKCQQRGIALIPVERIQFSFRQRRGFRFRRQWGHRSLHRGGVLRNVQGRHRDAYHIQVITLHAKGARRAELRGKGRRVLRHGQVHHQHQPLAYRRHCHLVRLHRCRGHRQRKGVDEVGTGRRIPDRQCEPQGKRRGAGTHVPLRMLILLLFRGGLLWNIEQVHDELFGLALARRFVDKGLPPHRCLRKRCQDLFGFRQPAQVLIEDIFGIAGAVPVDALVGGSQPQRPHAAGEVEDCFDEGIARRIAITGDAQQEPTPFAAEITLDLDIVRDFGERFSRAVAD
ncbi:MAG: hypothetical protein BWY76_01854 [bacterium ADurb.Bin429]|nr:MAG: hypothetical protein BWY76_01854 [bacterium ADurb.Bin429]